MKKLLYTLIASLPFFTSCEEADFGVKAADPQSWEQEEVITLPGLTATAVATIDLAQAGDSVAIFNPSMSGALPEGATLDNFRVELATENGTKTLDASTTGKVAAADLQAAIEELYGKRPEERSFNATVYANVMVNGQASLVKGETTVKAIPVAPVIESAYYLVGAPNGWDWTNGDYQFSHSDKDVYDDPVFTLTFNAPVDKDGKRVDCWFKINPQSAFEAGAETNTTLGCETDGSTELEGTLVAKGETSCGAINMPASDGAKFYRITLNMMDNTYKVEILNFQEFIYVPGNHQNWNPGAAPALQSPNFDGVYVGYTYLNGNFKFTKERNWNGEYNFNDFATKDDIFFNNDGSNINISEEGFYQITADVAASKLSAVKTTWSIIGSATGDPNWGTDLEMTYVTEDESWKYTGALTAGEFKFRANKDWTLSFGGASFDDLTSDNGANLKIEEEGNYEVKFFLTRSTSDKIYCTVTKK